MTTSHQQPAYAYSVEPDTDGEDPAAFTYDAKDLINYVDSKHLASIPALRDFVTFAMLDPPVIPVGCDRQFFYRVVVEVPSLRSDDNNCSLTSLASPAQVLLPHYLLGLNKATETEATDQANAGARLNNSPSTRSSYSEDAHSAGSVFLQLGQLEYASHYSQDDWSPSVAEFIAPAVYDEDLDYDWESTGYNLVARLDSNGRVDGIYAVYNMFQFHPFEGRIEHVKLTYAV